MEDCRLSTENHHTRKLGNTLTNKNETKTITSVLKSAQIYDLCTGVVYAGFGDLVWPKIIR